MQTLAIIGFVVTFSVLLLIAAISPNRSSLSNFELERRKKAGNKTAAEELDRAHVLGDIVSLQRVIAACLLTISTLLAIVGFGWFIGGCASVLVALFYGRLANTEFIRAISDKVYLPYSGAIVEFVKKRPMLGSFVRTVGVDTREVRVSSREELEHLVRSAEGILSHDEKQSMLHNLSFSQKTVESIMTPRGVIDTISADELIGPITLDELHKTGHSRFPVINQDIDHIVGVLHIRELLTLGDKSSQLVSDHMEKRVYYINQEQTLDHALAAFLRTRHQLFVVVNGYRETAGILALEDVIESLLGRKIIDEFDLHEDLRVVAARSAALNNNGSNGRNV